MIDSVKQRSSDKEETNVEDEENTLDNEEGRFNNDENGFDEKKTNVEESMPWCRAKHTQYWKVVLKLWA